MKRNKILIISNLFLLLLLVVIVIREKYPERIKNRLSFTAHHYSESMSYRVQTDYYKYYQKKGTIVMLGNSITAGINWSELLNRDDIINRGIGRDITEGFINRMDDVINVNPQICFIMGGFNDIVRGKPSKIITSNLESISMTLIRNNVEPIIQSILYASKVYHDYEHVNEKIHQTNLLIKEMCESNNVEYLDLNDKMGNEKVLIEQYSYDGVHLTGLGYDKWKSIIEPIIKEKVLCGGSSKKVVKN